MKKETAFAIQKHIGDGIECFMRAADALLADMEQSEDVSADDDELHTMIGYAIGHADIELLGAVYREYPELRPEDDGATPAKPDP